MKKKEDGFNLSYHPPSSKHLTSSYLTSHDHFENIGFRYKDISLYRFFGILVFPINSISIFTPQNFDALLPSNLLDKNFLLNFRGFGMKIELRNKKSETQDNILNLAFLRTRSLFEKLPSAKHLTILRNKRSSCSYLIVTRSFQFINSLSQFLKIPRLQHLTTNKFSTCVRVDSTVEYLFWGFRAVESRLRRVESTQRTQ